MSRRSVLPGGSESRAACLSVSTEPYSPTYHRLHRCLITLTTHSLPQADRLASPTDQLTPFDDCLYGISQYNTTMPFLEWLYNETKS